jgi:hypothetical protein
MGAASVSDFPALLAELAEQPADAEHASVSVSHDSEWTLSAHRGGYLVFENLEEGEPRHMTAISDSRIIALWTSLAEGDLDALEREPWQKGYR